jgi:hypothetical protein
MYSYIYITAETQLRVTIYGIYLLIFRGGTFNIVLGGVGWDECIPLLSSQQFNTEYCYCSSTIVGIFSLLFSSFLFLATIGAKSLFRDGRIVDILILQVHEKVQTCQEPGIVG